MILRFLVSYPAMIFAAVFPAAHSSLLIISKLSAKYTSMQDLGRKLQVQQYFTDKIELPAAAVRRTGIGRH